MVTKYDVFEYVYRKGGPVKPQEVSRAFRHIAYHSAYAMLQQLKTQGLLVKNAYGFQANMNQKNDRLFRLIGFCLKNDLNYNELLDKNLAAFISGAFQKKRVTVKDAGLDSRTFSKYVEILTKDGLALRVSRKPLVVAIPYNSFLRDVVAHFGQNALVAKARSDEYLDEIDKELRKFRRLRSANEARYRRVVDETELHFIHHSLSLEGNPITLPDTRKLLKEHIVPSAYSTESVQEVQNYQKAIAQMSKDAEDFRPITRESILRYHQLAMAHRTAIAGKIRSVPVMIRWNPDFSVAEASEIEPQLASLLEAYNQFIANKKQPLKSILAFSSRFHNEFQHIHPFEDGNSRTTRLITFHLLRTQNIPLLDIPLGLLEEYVFSTKGAAKRDDKKLKQVLQQIILYNLKAINGKLS